MAVMKSHHRVLEPVLRLLYLLWAFTESDLLTFVIPNSLFGLFSALALPALVDAPPVSGVTASSILLRMPLVVLFNVGNLLIFDLSNQRSPSSILEDSINKPWRPIPSGRVTARAARRALLAAIPLVLALSYSLGVAPQSAAIMLLAWMYNDLQGGDEAVVREAIIAFGYAAFNWGSLEVALGATTTITTTARVADYNYCYGNGNGNGPMDGGLMGASSRGFVWTAMISGVIFTTMQVQDLKDQEGDKTRGRKTIALFLGEEFSRCSIAGFVCFWTCVCSHFWQLSPLAFAAFAVTAVVVVLRVLLVRWSPWEDAKTWKWWCLWHSTLYLMPLVSLAEKRLR
ncbi:hypothetical protein VTK26DRAFT_6798 [Humicola hyalothermophila]